MTDLTIAELKEQIKRYEQELQTERANNYVRRDKITTMSAEVVDSNPYRYYNIFFFTFIAANLIKVFRLNI